ncbi:ankyrin repeat domain-containing protein [Sphingobium algorifonticola]|uniref:Ankyrin repeat domain-containing protein n=1 Tax=Sphingobium algorifonticola TaxID=2008318 RepID=A0A437JDT2_9SPHN|nr:ankyrin repeat domain-containing protein [Sphingobium algorifonticola]
MQQLLFDAAREGRDDMVQPLLRAGANIEARDPKGFTALILASYHGHRAATRALLSAGAHVDSVDLARGNSALMGVAFKGYAELARDLLAEGATVDLRNNAGQTALMNAALFGHYVIVELLLHAGADPHAMDSGCNSARSLAMDQGNADMLFQLDSAMPPIGVLNG